MRQIVENADGAGAWVLHDAAKNIYRIQLTEDWDLKVGAQSTPSNQVFADGEILVEARWPNIGSYLNLRETDWALGRGSFTGSANPYSGSYAAAGLEAFSAGSLAGASIVFSPGQRWFVQQAAVSGNSGETVQFSFDKISFNYGFHMPDDGDRFFLTKSLALLDAPGEWFFDSAANVLYLRMPDSASPAGRAIEMRRNDRFFDLSSSNYLRFENLRFTATYIFSGSGNHGFVFANCRFAHLTNGLFRSGLSLNGNGNQVLDSTFLGDAGTPVHLRDGTAGNVVENNVVGDAHYLDGYGVAVSVQGAQSVRHNTVFNAGGHGISVTGAGAAVQRNRVYYFGALVQDVAGINAFGGGNQGGAEWSHNVVHDGLAGYGDFPGNNGTLGIRIDNGGAARACYNVVIHHNLVWGVSNSGLNIWGVQDSQLAPGDTQASVNIRIYNSTVVGASKMVGRSADGFKFAGISWRNNIFDGLLSGNDNTSLSTATIQSNLLRSGSIAGNATGAASFVDAGESDYRLASGSPGIDAGQALPPYTDGVADGLPDLGAFERGQLPWRAGALVTSADLAGIALSYEGGNDFVLRGLPPGRTVPDGFRVRIGGVRFSSTEPVVATDLATHETVVHLAIDVSGLTGNQLIEYSLDGATFLNPGRFINVSDTGAETVEAPSHLGFYNPSNDSVTLLWRDNSANEESFEVQIASDLNFSADFQSVTVPANETVRVFSGLVPDKTYYFRVQAKNATLGDSIFSPIASTRVGRMGLTLRHPDDDGTEFAIAYNPVMLNGASALVTITDPAVTALRFAGAPIPAGATILEANLQFKTGVEYLNTVARARFSGERVADSAPLLAQAFNMRNRLSTATAALVAWNDIPPWYKDEVTSRQMSPDLSAIVQEIVSLPGWQSGNALTFLAQDNGSSSWEASRSFSTADDSLSNTTLFVRFTTPAAPSVAVSGLAAAASGQNGMSLTWAYSGTGQSGFRIERSSTGTRRFEPVAVVAGDARAFSDTGLNPGTAYYYRIRPINSGGIGPTSPVASATTEAQPPPSAPASLAATAVNHSRIDLAWTDTSSDEAGFEIQRSGTGEESGFATVATLPANTTSHQDSSGLTPETAYYYRVRAIKDFSASAWTAPATATTLPLPPPPSAPSALTVLWLSHDGARIGWTDNSADETGFEIQRSPSGAEGTFATVATVAANTAAFADSGLQPRTQYFYRVRSTNGVTHSEWTAPVSFATRQLDEVLQNPTTGWFRGCTSSVPASSISVQNSSELVHFTGGAAGSNEQYAQVWRYLAPSGSPLALEDGGMIRLTVVFSHQGTAATVARALRFGFYNSNGSRIEADIGGNNNPAHVDDAGYGFAIATGANSTTRYVADAADSTAPLRTAMTDVAPSSGLLGVADNQPRTLRFEIVRSGNDILLRAYVEGELFDGGRTVANAAATAFDMLMLCHRSSGATWTIHSLAVERSVPTDVAPVNPPASFAASGAAPDRMSLAWADNSAAESGFEIQRSYTGFEGTYEPLATTGPDATSYSDASALSYSTSYHYRIRALGEFGNHSPWVSAYGTTAPLPAPPGAPSGLTQTGAGNSAIEISWADNSAAESGFEIQRSATGAYGSFVTVALAAAGATSHTDTGLSAATRYFYRLRATNGYTHSDWAPPVAATTSGTQALLQNPTTAWYRGMIASSPASSLTVQSVTEISHFTGGSGWTHDYYAQFWRYFAPVAIADGETLRLSVTFAYPNDGTRPNIDRALRFALLNSNGTQATADINSNNSPSHTEDCGYGIALSSGTNTTSRYIEERPDETTSSPLRTEMRDLGASTGTWSVNDSADHTLVFDLRRQGAELHILAALDGAPFDGGRVVAAPHTFTYDMLMLANRTRGVSWVVRSLSLEKITPVAQLPSLTAWRFDQFGHTDEANGAADLDDPDADGIPNLVEYALGTSPTDAGNRPLLESQISNLRLQMAFTPDVTSGLRYIIEASTDLSDWSEAYDITGALIPGHEYTHTDSADLANTPRRFLRLRVVR